jgi:hypothetical protein
VTLGSLTHAQINAAQIRLADILDSLPLRFVCRWFLNLFCNEQQQQQQQRQHHPTMMTAATTTTTTDGLTD